MMAWRRCYLGFQFDGLSLIDGIAVSWKACLDLTIIPGKTNLEALQNAFCLRYRSRKMMFYWIVPTSIRCLT